MAKRRRSVADVSTSKYRHCSITRSTTSSLGYSNRCASSCSSRSSAGSRSRTARRRDPRRGRVRVEAAWPVRAPETPATSAASICSRRFSSSERSSAPRPAGPNVVVVGRVITCWCFDKLTGSLCRSSSCALTSSPEVFVRRLHVL